MPVNVEKIEYKRFGECIRLADERFELVIMVGKGPRIIRFALQGGENVFAELDGEGFETDNGFWHMIGGHRLWHSPEASPRTYTPDAEPVHWEEIDNGARVVQKPHAYDQLQKEMEITLENDAVRVVHRIANHSLWPIEFSVWALSIMAAGGVLIVPQNTEETGLLPNRSVIYWPYTDVRDARASLGNRYMLVRQGPGKTPFMFGQPNERGWAAYAVNGCLFAKTFDFSDNARYPDYGCSFESYCCDFMIEVESLSPLRTVAPGESSVHEERWTLHNGATLPGNEDEAEALIKRYGIDNL